MLDEENRGRHNVRENQNADDQISDLDLVRLSLDLRDDVRRLGNQFQEHEKNPSRPGQKTQESVSLKVPAKRIRRNLRPNIGNKHCSQPFELTVAIASLPDAIRVCAAVTSLANNVSRENTVDEIGDWFHVSVHFCVVHKIPSVPPEVFPFPVNETE